MELVFLNVMKANLFKIQQVKIKEGMILSNEPDITKINLEFGLKI